MATLPTKLLIDAARTQAQSKCQIMTFLQKGDPDSGQILLVFFDALSLYKLLNQLNVLYLLNFLFLNLLQQHNFYLYIL